MPHTLEYRYQPGETLVYAQTVTMILREPDDDEPLGGRAEIELVQHVGSVRDDGWSLDVQQRVTATEGLLADHIPDGLRDKQFRLTVDRRGTLLEVPEGPPPARMPAFPEGPVDAGEAWSVRESGIPGSPPLELQYLLERFEEAEGDVLAHLVSVGHTEGPDEGLTTHIQGSTVFSVATGCQVQSTTVVEMKWPAGRTMQILVENRLLDRQAAPAVDLDGVF